MQWSELCCYWQFHLCRVVCNVACKERVTDENEAEDVEDGGVDIEMTNCFHRWAVEVA